MPTYETALGKLSSLGTRVGQFNQAKYALTLLEKKTSGYCLGVCMDWMRRILQGAKGDLRPEAAGRADKERISRLRQTTARGFKAYAVVETLLQNSKKGYEDLKLVYANFSQLSRELYALSKVVQPTYVLTSPLKEKLKKETLTRKELEALYDSVCAKQADLDKTLTPEEEQRQQLPPAALLWGGIVAKMDPFHAGMNEQFSRGQTRRRYAGIGPVKDGAARGAHLTVTAALNWALGQSCFSTGRGMIFEVLTTEDPTDNRSEEGHAHGLYKENNDSYLFLDANFGVFRYPQASLCTAVAYLWENNDVTGEAYYPENKMHPIGQFSYTTFAKAE